MSNTTPFILQPRLLLRANIVRMSQVYASCLVGLRWSLASTTMLLIVKDILVDGKVNMRPLGFRQLDDAFSKVARGDSSEVTL